MARNLAHIPDSDRFVVPGKMTTDRRMQRFAVMFPVYAGLDKFRKYDGMPGTDITANRKFVPPFLIMTRGVTNLRIAVISVSSSMFPGTTKSVRIRHIHIPGSNGFCGLDLNLNPDPDLSLREPCEPAKSAGAADMAGPRGSRLIPGDSTGRSAGTGLIRDRD